MDRGAPRPGAVVEIHDGAGNVTRLRSFTCCHCGDPKVVPEGARVEDVSDICRSCWRLHCLGEACASGCAPFLRKLDAMEARAASLRSMGLA